jgi:hypothetical protein
MRLTNNSRNPGPLPPSVPPDRVHTFPARLEWAYGVGKASAIIGLEPWARPGLFAAARMGLPIGLAYVDGYLSIQS